MTRKLELFTKTAKQRKVTLNIFFKHTKKVLFDKQNHLLHSAKRHKIRETHLSNIAAGH